MAIQVVPREASLGENFGKSLATGLGSQLASLGGQAIGAGAGALGAGLGKLGQKMGILEEPKKLTKEILTKAGFSDADADIILAMPPQFQFKMMEAIAAKAPAESQPDEGMPEKGKALEGQVSESFKKAYEDIKGVPFDSTIPQEAAPEQEMAVTEEGVVPSQRAPGEEPMLAEPSAQQPTMQTPKAMAKPIESRPSALFRKPAKEVEMEKRRMAHEEKEDKKIAISEDKLQFQKEEAAKKAQREMSKEDRKEQHYIDAQTKPFYEKTSEMYKEARKTTMRTGRMTEIIDSGELTNSLWSTFVSFLEDAPLGKHGPQLPSLNVLRNASDVEFNKLSKDFLKGAKAIFGSRVTEGEIKLFLQTVPDLNMTDEGKKRIIHNMELFAKGARIEYDIMNEIIEENGGNRPKNLEALVSNRADPILDELAEEFKKGSRLPKKTEGSKDEIKQESSGGKPLSSMLVNKIFG